MDLVAFLSEEEGIVLTEPFGLEVVLRTLFATEASAVWAQKRQTYVLNNQAVLLRDEAGRLYFEATIPREVDVARDFRVTPSAALMLEIGGRNRSVDGAVVPLVALQYQEVKLRVTFLDLPPAEWTISYDCCLLASERRDALMRAPCVVCPNFRCAQGCLVRELDRTEMQRHVPS